MRLYDISGRLVNRPVNQYVIDWDGKSASNIQFKVKQFLKPYWRQYMVYEEFPVFGTQMRVDFINLSLRIAVEVNGDQHYEFNEHFHRGQPANYLYSIKRDALKEKWLHRNNFKIVEIYQEEADKLSKAFFKEKFDITL